MMPYAAARTATWDEHTAHLAEQGREFSAAGRFSSARTDHAPMGLELPVWFALSVRQPAGDHGPTE